MLAGRIGCGGREMGERRGLTGASACGMRRSGASSVVLAFAVALALAPGAPAARPASGAGAASAQARQRALHAYSHLRAVTAYRRHWVLSPYRRHRRSRSALHARTAVVGGTEAS